LACVHVDAWAFRRAYINAQRWVLRPGMPWGCPGKHTHCCGNPTHVLIPQALDKQSGEACAVKVYDVTQVRDWPAAARPDAWGRADRGACRLQTRSMMWRRASLFELLCASLLASFCCRYPGQWLNLLHSRLPLVLAPLLPPADTLAPLPAPARPPMTNKLGKLNKAQLIREIKLHGSFAHRNIVELWCSFQVRAP
jgi:hypothetical protein